MKLPSVPQIPPPRDPDEAFRSGVRGAPYVQIDHLPVIPVVVSRRPGPNLLEIERRVAMWPPAVKIAKLEAYSIGRAVRGIALLSDECAAEPMATLQLLDLICTYGIMHVRLRQPYALDVFLDDFQKTIEQSASSILGSRDVHSMRAQIVAFATKHRVWDEHDF